MKGVIAIGILGVLAGCASQAIPRLPVDKYSSFAQVFVGLEQCSLSGYLTVQQSALGKYQYSQMLSTWAFDQGMLGSEIQSIANRYSADASGCREIAEWVEMNKIKSEQIRNNARMATTVRQPTYTNCSTYFGQTHCTSF